MIGNAKWRSGSHYTNAIADANKCAQEIMSIEGNITRESVLEKAKDENSELHKCFEWDDGVAAEQYRLYQAGQIIRFIVIDEEEKPEDRPEIRVFHITEKSEGYKPIQYIVRKEDEYSKLLEKAWAELRTFKAKYKCLEELRDILDLID